MIQIRKEHILIVGNANFAYLLTLALLFICCFLVVIDDVWSATMLDKIIKELPNHNDNKENRIIVTTRFHAVATTRRGEADIRKVKGLGNEESKKLFRQAFLESTTSKIEEGDLVLIFWPLSLMFLFSGYKIFIHNICSPWLSNMLKSYS